ncbi:MAG: spermidine synthase, partial [Bdellovibrionota bacterium]|nr:spermidine synthase [Bdellovibrionota bacterium]
MTDQDWIYERNEEGFSLGFKVKERLFCGKSDFQKVEIVDTYSHGKVLLNDDLVMLSERDEFAYHDMITHLPLFTHGNPKNVLVIGGGDGGTAREVLRHESVERCVMVEIDKMVVDACIEHIPVTSKDLTNHPKLELLIEDGVKYVKETKERFDVIIIDSTDPIGPATPLFG